MPRPQLHYSDILEWADEHRARTGEFPKQGSGLVEGHPDEKWRNLDMALRAGLRGLPGGSSLAQLLAKKRGHRNRKALPKYTLIQILKWADAHHRRTGEWPKNTSGPIPERPGETWEAVNQALRNGIRGLPGGSSLPQFLEAKRGVPNVRQLPKFTVRQILIWADAYHALHGDWPTSHSGQIASAPAESWLKINSALRQGIRGFSKSSSLAQFLAKHRGVRNTHSLPKLSVKQILMWADAHFERTEDWPTSLSGPIPDSNGETWSKVHSALVEGYRGLPGNSSLFRLLAAKRGVKLHVRKPPFREDLILAWADAHKHRTGNWPSSKSGRIEGAPETWLTVHLALKLGQRGLAGGASLAEFLAEKRGARNHLNRPAHSLDRILVWAEAHRKRTGHWPNRKSGAILEAPGETWRAMEVALYNGRRGLPGGSTLAKLRDLAMHEQSKNAATS